MATVDALMAVWGVEGQRVVSMEGAESFGHGAVAAKLVGLLAKAHTAARVATWADATDSTLSAVFQSHATKVRETTRFAV